MPASAQALQALLRQRFPDAVPPAYRLSTVAATGIQALDRALPHGGFPLGKLSVCEPGGGVSAVLRSMCRTAVLDGERAAWIDGARTIAGAFWDGPALLVRPPSSVHAVRAADELLRSGGFRVVVLTGVCASEAETMRLVRAAHDGGGALVAVTSNTAMAALRMASRITDVQWRFDPFGEPAHIESVKISSDVRALGWSKRAEFSIPVVSYELPVSLESGLADRRGLPRTRLVRRARAS